MEGNLYDNQHLHNASLFQPPHPHHALVSQDLDLDANDPFQFNAPLDNATSLQHLHARSFYDPSLPQPIYPSLQLHTPRAPRRQASVNNGVGGGQFGILTPHPQGPNQPQEQSEDIGRYQNSFDIRTAPDVNNEPTRGHFSHLKFVPNPPNLEAWRQRLFDVTEPITMTEDE